MNLDRWRGKPGLFGWITLKWDIYQIKKFQRRLRRVMREQLEERMSETWRQEQIYRNGTTKRDEMP